MVTHLVNTAHSYVTEFHSVRTVATELGELLTRSIRTLSGAMSRWEEVEQAAEHSLISEVSSRWDKRVALSCSSPQSLMGWSEVLAPTFSELKWEQSNR